MRRLSSLLLLFFCLAMATTMHGRCGSLFDELLLVEACKRQQQSPFPVYYDLNLNGGYFQMPSARVGGSGEIAFGYSSAPPYINWNLRLQWAERLEIAGNYRIFKGVPDPILTPLGFGDLSDRGVNIKIALVRAEESEYQLPALAIGWQDFMGTSRFDSRYVVATQVFPRYGLELSCGYGWRRWKGWFGGLHWLPFWQRESLLAPLAFTVEWDATDYSNPEAEPHPRGREVRSRLNRGIKYRLWNSIDLSLGYLRGKKWAFALSGFYNFGQSQGLLPKIDDPLPYRAPLCVESLEGGLRSPLWLSVDLAWALRDQGMRLLETTLLDGSRKMRLVIVNDRWRTEREWRLRISPLLAALLPEEIEEVEVVVSYEGLAMQAYCFPLQWHRQQAKEGCTSGSLALVAQRRDLPFCQEEGSLVYWSQEPRYRLGLLPRTYTFFGSAKGKLRYSLGASLVADGFLPGELYYDLQLTYIGLASLGKIKSIDRLNPSQLPNVRSDIVCYLHRPGLKLEKGYLQKSWNLGEGWFSRVALGLFEIEYGGVAGELLYAPVNSRWALGWDAALLRKRTLSGLGFSDKVRQLNGFCASYRRFLASQAFCSLYYDWRELSINLRARAGKFLANDKGVRLELVRSFASGMEMTIWYTYTDGRDSINDRCYHDKGVAISLPLDLFYTYSCHKRWCYSLAAWLRDVGVIGGQGRGLYQQLYEQRR